VTIFQRSPRPKTFEIFLHCGNIFPEVEKMKSAGVRELLEMVKKVSEFVERV
jgi:hypothetical protein